MADTPAERLPLACPVCRAEGVEPMFAPRRGLPVPLVMYRCGSCQIQFVLEPADKPEPPRTDN
jgi:hypothetical protein